MASEAEIARMVVRLVGDQASFKAMLKDAERGASAAASSFERSGGRIESIAKSLDNASQRAHKVAGSLRGVGTALTVGVTAPLSALSAYAVKQFASFDQAMTETFAKMGKQTPEVRQQMEDVAKSLAMSGEVTYDPTELAKGYEELASAGLDAERSMAALPATAKFAQAGAFSLGVAVKQLTGSMASFGITTQSASPEQYAKEMAHFSDVIVGVANETTTGVEEVARAMSADAAVAAKEYGMSIEELGGVLGVYAMQNKDAEEAGNLTGRAIRLMTGSFTKKAKVWKDLGIDIVDPVTGEFIKFSDAIGLLEGSFKGLTGPQKVARLEMLGFETLAQKSILPLIGQSKELKRQEGLYKKQGTTQAMAAIQMESFASQMKVVKNYVKVAAIELGEVLAPSIKQVSEYLKAGILYWRALPKDTKAAIVTAGKIAAALSFVVMGIAGVVSVGGYLLGTLSALVSVVGFFLSPLGLTILALTAVGAALAYLASGGSSFGGLWDWVSTKMMSFGLAARGFLNNLQQNMSSILVWMQERWASLWGGLTFIVGEVLNGVMVLVNAVLPDLGLSWDDIGTSAMDAMMTALQYVEAFVVGAAGFFANFDTNARALMSFFRGNWKLIISDVLRFVEVLVGGLGTNAMVGLKILYRMFLAFGGWLKGMFQRLFSFEVLDAVLSGLIKIGEKIREWGKAAWETIKNIFKGKDSNAMGDWLDKAVADINQGEQNVNLLDTFAKIIQQESSGFQNPLAGFESQALQQMPQMDLSLQGPALNLQDNGQPLLPGMPAMPQVPGMPTLPQLPLPPSAAATGTAQQQAQQRQPVPNQAAQQGRKDEEYLAAISLGIKRLIEIGEAELKKKGTTLLPAAIGAGS